MQTQARDVVERHYTAFDAHTEDWKDLVTDDVTFDGYTPQAMQVITRDGARVA